MLGWLWKLIRLGLLAGTLAGLVWVVNRRTRHLAPRLIDWDRVRRAAVARAQRDYLWVDWSLDYRALVEQSQRAVVDYVGEAFSQPLDAVYVYDRVEWLDANIASFRWLFEPLERLNQQSLQTGSLGARLMAGISQTVLSHQIGVLLGYLACRVLGQYDLALLGKSPVGGGRLYFVEPNIVQAQQQLGVDGYRFRVWIALHETTHAFEFEAHPWLREHINELLGRYFESLSSYLTGRAQDGGGLVGRFLAGLSTSQHLLELMMTSEQRQLFRQLQAIMCLVEGYSNHVMNQVGESLLPDYERIKNRFARRLRQRTLSERLFAKLTGLDIKRQQYQWGEEFVNQVVGQRGIAFANRAWAAPENLPTLEEVREPARWVKRMEASPA